MPPTTMITVAPTGAETAKAAAPSLPVTLAELVRAARCTMGTVNVGPDVASPAETRKVLGIRSA